MVSQLRQQEAEGDFSNFLEEWVGMGTNGQSIQKIFIEHILCATYCLDTGDTAVNKTQKSMPQGRLYFLRDK